MIRSFGDRGLAYEFMREKLNIQHSDDFRGALFVPEEFVNQPASQEHVGVAYAWNNFIGRTCTINIVVQKPECLTRPIIREAFRFPFVECGCEVLLALVDSKNLESVSLCRRVGFKVHSRIVDGGIDEDLIIFSMRRNECRWLKQEH